MILSAHTGIRFSINQRINTLQIGNGQSIANKSQKLSFAIFDLWIFLLADKEPLVPIGDQLLFKEYDYCPNLGGFSNVSYQINGIRKAYDICPVNIVLNYLTQQQGQPFDKNGAIAQTGYLIDSLFAQLNQLTYYKEKGPKSLEKNG